MKVFLVPPCKMDVTDACSDSDFGLSETGEHDSAVVVLLLFETGILWVEPCDDLLLAQY